MSGYLFGFFVIVVAFQIFVIEAQFPQRLNIPGAVLLQANKGVPPRPQRLHHSDSPIPLRVRKPIPSPLPISIPIREDIEDETRVSILDDEVSRLSISSLQSSFKQQENDESEPPRPAQFRPERPLPILRQDIRESLPSLSRPLIRQELDDEKPQRPLRPPPPQAIRQSIPPPPPNRQKVRPSPNPRPAQQYLEDNDDVRRNRLRKPPVQILRKYRTDNQDGSITWGFENEDGTFKEETIGADCIIKGKYGYIDPEGTRRQYAYEAGNKCDHREGPEEEYPLVELPPQQTNHHRLPPGKKIPLKLQK